MTAGTDGTRSNGTDETVDDTNANGTDTTTDDTATTADDTRPQVSEAVDTAAPARKAARREMGVTMMLILAGAALVLSLSGRVWAEGTALAHDSRFAIEATGSSVSKMPTALALLGLAAAVAVFATRGRGRMLVGALLVLGGAGIVATAVSGVRDRSALDSVAASKAAVEGVRAIDVTHTFWPWVTALGGALILLGGLSVIVRGRAWPGMGSRYEAPGTRAPRRTNTSADMWNALDRGEDPTQ